MGGVDMVRNFINKYKNYKMIFKKFLQVIPPKDSVKEQQSFDALVVALLDLDKVALVRYISRKNSAPKLGALLPCI